jgi:hypothetical protein
MTVRRALEWQRAWADGELGYDLTDEDRALLEDARRRPDFYMKPGRASKPKATSRRRTAKPYRLPFTIV